LSIGQNGALPPTLFIIWRNKETYCLEKTITDWHMSPADERPGLGFAGCVHENSLKRFSPRPSDFSNQPTTLATRDVFRTPRFRRPHQRVGRFAA
jgi:hypothetical protein